MVLVVARETVLECCASAVFADKVAKEAYADIDELISIARGIWWNQVSCPILGTCLHAT
mgnify:CR=1 FL=1